MSRTYFGPAEIAVLVAAYEHALARLQLESIDNAATRLVAKRIILLAMAGEHDPVRLSNRAIEMGLATPERATQAALVYPESEKSGRGKKNAAQTSATRGGFSTDHIDAVRGVLARSPNPGHSMRASTKAQHPQLLKS